MSHPTERMKRPVFPSPYWHPGPQFNSDHSHTSSDSEDDADIWNPPRHATTSFLHVLTAPYFPPPAAPSLLFSTSNGGDAEESSVVMDWSSVPPNDSGYDSSECEENIPVRRSTKLRPLYPEDAEIVPCKDDHERYIYSPHDKWAWTAGLAIESPEVLMHLGSGVMCTATIKKGQIGGREITYVSKCWSRSQQHLWDGFHSELALYKCRQYLQPLQGNVIPQIIGVYSLPAEISVAMEPPHHSFWIEASPDMPVVLKEQCIDAFQKIHDRGVLHGDPELRHMLIGADGKVTIIDFQYSRALVFNDEVHLEKADPSEFRLEMRKVKFKLDYCGAREYEKKKAAREHQRWKTNEAKCRKTAREPGYIPEYEDLSNEDKVDPPIDSQDWVDSWLKAMNATPRRFVMPGQTPEDVQRNVQGFLEMLQLLEVERGYGNPFAQTPATEEVAITKRPRHDTPNPLERAQRQTVITSPSLSLFDNPMITENDFACEIPATSELHNPLLAMFRRFDGEASKYTIRRQVGRKCLDADLPHPEVLHHLGKRAEDDPVQSLRLKRGLPPLKSQGNLKRTMEEMVNPGAAAQVSARKKARYERDKLATGSEPISRKRKRDDDEDHMPPGPKILSRVEYLAHLGRARPSNSLTGQRGILRKDVALKSIFQSQEPFTDYVIRRVGNRLAVVGVRYGNTPLGKRQRVPYHTSDVSRPSPKRSRVSKNSVHVQTLALRSLANWVKPLLWWF